MSFFKELGDGLTLGFLRKPLKKATGLSDIQLAGLTAAAAFGGPAIMGAMGGSGAAGAAGAGGAGAATTGAAGAAEAGGLMSYAKPVMAGLQGASMAKGLLSQPEQPIQSAPIQQQQANFGGLLSNPQMAEDEKQKRLMQQQQALMGLLGRNYG